MKRILALDPATVTGFCVGTSSMHVSGVWNLSPRRFDGGGMRFVKLEARLNEILKAYGSLDAVFYEEVRRHKGVDAAHIYGGLIGKIGEWCEQHEIPYEALPVGEIKKNWTGNGSAGKKAMMAEAQRRGFDPQDDNEADAIAIFDLGLERLGEQKLSTEAEPQTAIAGLEDLFT